MKEELNEIIEYIKQWLEIDPKAYNDSQESLALNINKNLGKLINLMFLPTDTSETDEENKSINISVNYNDFEEEFIVVYIYVIALIIVSVKTDESLNKILQYDDDDVLKNVEEIFGFDLAVELSLASSTLLSSMSTNNILIFTSSMKVLFDNLEGLRILLGIDDEYFYGITLATLQYKIENLKTPRLLPEYSEGENSKNKLTEDAIEITLGVKLDKRFTNPTPWFTLQLDEKKKPIVFKKSNVYLSFLSSMKYVNDTYGFDNIELMVDSKAKDILLKNSVMFIKDDDIIENIAPGYYPILIPQKAKVTCIDDFLDIINKK
jgi:hypothetical protein